MYLFGSALIWNGIKNTHHVAMKQLHLWLLSKNDEKENL